MLEKKVVLFCMLAKKKTEKFPTCKKKLAVETGNKALASLTHEIVWHSRVQMLGPMRNAQECIKYVASRNPHGHLKPALVN